MTQKDTRQVEAIMLKIGKKRSTNKYTIERCGITTDNLGVRGALPCLFGI